MPQYVSIQVRQIFFDEVYIATFSTFGGCLPFCVAKKNYNCRPGRQLRRLRKLNYSSQAQPQNERIVIPDLHLSSRSQCRGHSLACLLLRKGNLPCQYALSMLSQAQIRRHLPPLTETVLRKKPYPLSHEKKQAGLQLDRKSAKGENRLSRRKVETSMARRGKQNMPTSLAKQLQEVEQTESRSLGIPWRRRGQGKVEVQKLCPQLRSPENPLRRHRPLQLFPLQCPLNLPQGQTAFRVPAGLAGDLCLYPCKKASSGLPIKQVLLPCTRHHVCQHDCCCEQYNLLY